MKHGPPPAVRVIVIVAILAVAYWVLFGRNGQNNEGLSASGTIETTQVAISPEFPGRITQLFVTVGQNVTAGQALARLDTTLLEGQLAQAQAGLAVAQANYDLLAAGPSETQLAAAWASLQRGQTALDAVNEQLATVTEQKTAIDHQIEQLNQQLVAANTTIAIINQQLAVPPAGITAEQLANLQISLLQAQTSLAGLSAQLPLAQQAQTALTAQIKLLESQVTMAESGLDTAQAQLDLLLAGARPEQLAIAQAQVAAAQASLQLLQSQITRQTLLAPVDGVVLARSVEPGEVVSPGATLLLIGQLSELHITVYVPEDRYGLIRLGQQATITVDSFPGRSFSGVVGRIADQAEFTPRNVQTAAGRASTVFAIELLVTDSSGQLKPGMPADVHFDNE